MHSFLGCSPPCRLFHSCLPDIVAKIDEKIVCHRIRRIGAIPFGSGICVERSLSTLLLLNKLVMLILVQCSCFMLHVHDVWNETSTTKLAISSVHCAWTKCRCSRDGCCLCCSAKLTMICFRVQGTLKIAKFSRFQVKTDLLFTHVSHTLGTVLCAN